MAVAFTFSAQIRSAKISCRVPMRMAKPSGKNNFRLPIWASHRCCPCPTSRFYLLVGQILTDSLSFIDSAFNEQNTHLWAAKLGGTVSTVYFAQGFDFQLFPNPIFENQNFNILEMKRLFKKILLLAVLGASAHLVLGQCPSPNIVVLKSQGQIDSFAIHYPGCDSVSLLEISGAGITNLDGLLPIRKIKSVLRIENNPLLESLIGLDNLERVTASFTIINNPLLQNVEGLEKLSSVGLYFIIRDNAGLQNLKGLTGIKRLDATAESGLTIFRNDALTSLEGLDSLQFVRDFVEIGDNDNLQSLGGLNRLDSVGGFLRIVEHQGLIKLDGLKKLQQAKKLNLEFNPKLMDISSLQNFRKAENILISGNHSLPNLDGLSKLAKIGVLDINNMDRLRRLTNFDSLITVGTIKLYFCDSLESLYGFDALKTVENVLDLGWLGIKNLDGLSNLTHVGEELQFNNLDSIQNVSGLKKLAFAKKFALAGCDFLPSLDGLNDTLQIGENLALQENLILSYCHVTPICRFLEMPNVSSSLWMNANGCNTAPEILSFCTSSAGDFSENLIIKIFPNPISENQTLQILLENDNFGKVKIEVLSLDGRLISIFEKEKTVQNQVFEIENLPFQHSFFVRVSDEKATVTRLIFKS